MVVNRILIGSPVRQDPSILQEFLHALLRVDRTGCQLDFVFVDDNDDAVSSRLLQDFSPGGRVTIGAGSGRGTAYTRTERTHFWREDLIWKVAAYKDWMIGLARDAEYDGLLLLDSDLVIHPLMLQQLLKANVDIISEVFWTRWQPEGPMLPQVWLSDQYTLLRQRRGEQLTPEQTEQRTLEFITDLLRPGIHEVGGLGACTLISRRAIQTGVSFSEIPNLGFHGEDRHFCVRAAALGLKLHAETSFPPLHLYRLSELSKLEEFIAQSDDRAREIAALESFKRAAEARFTVHQVTATGEEGLAEFAPTLAAQLRAESQAHLQSAGMDDMSRLYVGAAQVGQASDGSVVVDADAVQIGRDGGTAYRDGVGLKALMTPRAEGWEVAQLELQQRQAAIQIPFVRKTRNNRVTLSMLVRNEADKYLERVLSHAAQFVDAAVIVDDASTDDTVSVCREMLRDLPHTIVTLPESQFHEEWLLRRKQWDLTLATRPDWILNLDADQLFEDRMRDQIRSLVDQDRFDAVSFRLYDMWDEHHYRDDDLWQAHRRAGWVALVRNLPGLSDEWRETGQHSGHFPIAVHRLPMLGSDIRLKHFGWASEEQRRSKYERYMRLDPNGTFGSAAQYRSILDPNPRLITWDEGLGGPRSQRAA